MNKEAGLSLKSTAKKDKNPAIFFISTWLHNGHVLFYLTSFGRLLYATPLAVLHQYSTTVLSQPLTWSVCRFPNRKANPKFYEAIIVSMPEMPLRRAESSPVERQWRFWSRTRLIPEPFDKSQTASSLSKILQIWIMQKYFIFSALMENNSANLYNSSRWRHATSGRGIIWCSLNVQSLHTLECEKDWLRFRHHLACISQWKTFGFWEQWLGGHLHLVDNWPLGPNQGVMAYPYPTLLWRLFSEGGSRWHIHPCQTFDDCQMQWPPSHFPLSRFTISPYPCYFCFSFCRSAS